MWFAIGLVLALALITAFVAVILGFAGNNKRSVETNYYLIHWHEAEFQPAESPRSIRNRNSSKKLVGHRPRANARKAQLEAQQTLTDDNIASALVAWRNEIGPEEML